MRQFLIPLYLHCPPHLTKLWWFRRQKSRVACLCNLHSATPAEAQVRPSHWEIIGACATIYLVHPLFQVSHGHFTHFSSLHRYCKRTDIFTSFLSWIWHSEKASNLHIAVKHQSQDLNPGWIQDLNPCSFCYTIQLASFSELTKSTSKHTRTALLNFHLGGSNLDY